MEEGKLLYREFSKFCIFLRLNFHCQINWDEEETGSTQICRTEIAEKSGLVLRGACWSSFLKRWGSDSSPIALSYHNLTRIIQKICNIPFRNLNGFRFLLKTSLVDWLMKIQGFSIFDVCLKRDDDAERNQDHTCSWESTTAEGISPQTSWNPVPKLYIIIVNRPFLQLRHLFITSFASISCRANFQKRPFLGMVVQALALIWSFLAVWWDL